MFISYVGSLSRRYIYLSIFHVPSQSIMTETGPKRQVNFLACGVVLPQPACTKSRARLVLCGLPMLHLAALAAVRQSHLNACPRADLFTEKPTRKVSSSQFLSTSMLYLTSFAKHCVTVRGVVSTE